MSVDIPLKAIRRDGAGTDQHAYYNATTTRWQAGGWVEYADNATLGTNTTGTYVAHVTLVTSANTPAGIFELLYQWTWSITSTSSSVDVQCRLDTVEEYFTRQHSIVNGAFNNPRVTVRLRTVLTAGAHTFDIRYRRDIGAGNAQMRYSRISARWLGV